MDALASAIIRTLKYTTIGEVHPVLGTRCLEWTGPKDERGRPRIVIFGRMTRVHRFVLACKDGVSLDEVDSGAHRCDNPGCVGPDHLFRTDHAGNMADCKAKGRTTKGRPGPNIGRKASAETLVRMRLAVLGRRDTSETRAKKSASLKRAYAEGRR